jgi:SulP family sulfate permease
VLPDIDPASDHFVPVDDQPECPQIRFLRLNGSIFFGAVAHLQQQLQELEESSPELKHVVILASGINFVDLAGAELLAEQARHWRKKGGGLYFYRMKESVAALLQKGGFMDDIREYNVFPVGVRPIDILYNTLDKSVCSSCSRQSFVQCHAASGSKATVAGESRVAQQVSA